MIPVLGESMNSGTSTEPVRNQFDIKALVQAKLRAKKAEPVLNQYRTGTSKKAEPVLAGRNQYSEVLVSPSASENPVQKAGQNEGEEKTPCERIRQEFASPLPPLKAIPGTGVKPDYAAFCSAWHQGCFACPDFLPDKVRFCRKWNRTFTGADVVELITEGEEGAASPPLPEPALMEEDTGRGWWTYGREVNGLINTVDHKKGEVLTS